MGKSNVYKTNLVILSGFSVLYVITGNPWLLLPALLVFLVSVSSFKGAAFIAEKWMLTGKTIGTFNARILLTLTYFIVVVPTGFIKKISASKKGEQQTRWQRSKPLAENDFTRPF
ncbi:MAG: hypothetical protein V4658_08180 [Bacteroidota bacterium]